MIEYSSLLLSTLLFLLILVIPLRKFFVLRLVNFETNIFDNSALNVLFFSNIILILAILKINISTIIIIISSLMFLNFFLFFKSIKKNLFKIESILFLTSIIILLFILSVNISYNLTLGWDAQTIWFPRAINFYNELNFTEISLFARMPEYPFFGSLSWAFFWKIFFFDKEYYGRIFYLLIFLISILNFSDLLKTSIINKILFSFVLILITYDYWHFRGFQEILVFSFLLIISKYLYYIICENKTDLKYLSIILITTNLIIWTKNEGIIFSFFIYLLISLFSNYTLKIKIINFVFFFLIVFFRF